ncbi:MAG: mannitol dehydrogenase family protein [Geminicoccaceae bacterium]
MAARIIQFGTSRFLQAHVDLFVHEARQAGQAAGPITVVQVSPSADRAGRVAAFGRPEGYPVLIRGLEQGQRVDRRIDVTSVERGLAAVRDWQELRARFAGEADHIVSNTGEAGYDIAPADQAGAWAEAAVPASFPAKLAALLHHRWRDGARPLAVLPCELISGNGRVLKAAVLALVREARLPVAFADWLTREVPFADTLVDRIVATPLEPIGAIAEPYALWAVARQPGLTLPCTHPAIVATDDLEPYERLKLHILNLGHTALADLWRAQARDPGETVRAILAEAPVRDHLETIYREEVVPGFAAHGMGEAAEAYVATTLERFQNPFLDHKLADIAQHHATKVERRIAAFLAWSAEAGRTAPAPLLAAIVARGRASQGKMP